MKKSIAKKIKLGKRNRVHRAAMGRGHNRSRKSAGLLRKKRKPTTLQSVPLKLLKNYLFAR